MKFTPTGICRLLTESPMARRLSVDARWMLMVIVHSFEPQFRNDDLQQLCGFRSRNRLIKARKMAVEFGWLNYTPATKSQTGTYQVQIPMAVQLFELQRRMRRKQLCGADTEPKPPIGAREN
jgi:hypothetical protein